MDDPPTKPQQQQPAAAAEQRQQSPELTARAVAGGILVGGLMCFSNMYFGLQTGWVTMGSLQSALLGFGGFKLLEPYLSEPFTAAENVVLQTTAVATATMPLAGGFVGIIPALRILPAEQGGPVELSVVQLLGWCLALGFFGVFMAPPLRRQTILREKLPFPSGTATAEIIRQLHRLPPDQPETQGRRQEQDLLDDENDTVTEMTRLVHDAEQQPPPAPEGLASSSAAETSASSSAAAASAPAWGLLFGSFAISALYTLASHLVPILKNLPIGTWIGLPVLTDWLWTIQPSPSYVGQGLIMGPRVAISMLLGTVVGWGVLAPWARASGWAPGPIHDVRTGAQGWLLWVSLAIMLADSAVSLSMLTAKVVLQATKRGAAGGDGSDAEDIDPAPPSEQITWRMWLPGLIVASLLCTGIIAPMFTMPPYQLILAVLFSLLVAVLAVRALGETDLNPVSGIGKVSQLLFAAVAPGSIVANLVAGAVAEAGATSAGEMMQDLKCGHLLKSSPRAQFVAQLVGTLASCGTAVGAWLLYSSAYEIPGPEFPAPTAMIWLDMAGAVNGGHVATNVMPTAVGAAAVAAVLPLVELALPEGRRWVVPSGMAAAIGMYVTPNWTLPRVAGGVANWAWHKIDREGAERYMIVVASGFVLGEGLTSIVNAILQSAGIGALWCGGCPEDFCSGCP